MFKYSFFIFINIIFTLNAATPVYKVYDLGTLETDASMALAINDNGEVLGCYHDRGKWYIFIWNRVEGLKTIESPYPYCHFGKFNNKSHFVMQYIQDNKYKAYYWDEEWGFISIFPRDAVDIIDFNDNDQIIIRVKNSENCWREKYYVWNKGEISDIESIFSQEMNSEWHFCCLTAINNLGEIAVIAQTQIDTPNDKKTILKSFLYVDGKFKILLPEVGSEANVEIQNLDDERNVIVNIDGICYFYSPKKRIKAYFFNGNMGYKLKNGIPVCYDRLPSHLKMNEKGERYFCPGLQIGKILDTQGTGYIKNSCDGYGVAIYDQNSKGYVVGSMDTIYPSWHAFIAIPEEQTGSKPKMSSESQLSKKDY